MTIQLSFEYFIWYSFHEIEIARIAYTLEIHFTRYKLSIYEVEIISTSYT